MQSLAASYYELLGIGSQATLAEITAAYAERLATIRERIASDEAPPADTFDALRQAYHILRDPVARQVYDASRKSASSGEAASESAPPVIGDALGAAADAPTERSFQFVGDGGEYFRIWIVNILLSIVTFGIYSAWAKVRREQYFHRNLLLDGSGFDYHGQPSAILKGRIVAFLTLCGLSLAQQLSPLAYGIAILGLLPVVPWLLVKALRFRAHNTSYRGLRFSFHGTYAQAFKVFVGYGLLAVLTFWLAFPVFYRQLRKFMLDNTWFGTTQFNCSVTTTAIYKIFLLPALLFVILIAGVVLVFTSALSAGGSAALGFAFLLVPLLLVLSQALVLPYVAARSSNEVWTATRLGAHRFACRLPVGGYIGLTVPNWLAILLTLGLFIPWARVRLARFRAEYLALEIHGSLDAFVAGEARAATALGDEAAEMFDLDIGL